jgi:hypothetical protein
MTTKEQGAAQGAGQGKAVTRTHSAETARIRELNDRLRKTFTGGRVVMTTGVNALGPYTVGGILRKVTAYDQFHEGNDPHREHDFGEIEFVGRLFFWKIDYYAPGFAGGSEDPSDPAKTVRVLTIMLATEY